VSLPQIEAELVSWLREASQAQGYRGHLGVRDALMSRLDHEVHPKTVESWFRGTAMPAYGNLVALAWLLHELPPPLARVCPPDTESVVVVEDRSPDNADTESGARGHPRDEPPRG
jgi:hypothetical protein